MPELTRVLTETDVTAQRARPIMDLAPYLEIVDRITRQGGVGGEVTISSAESQRTEKRRLSLAAEPRGRKLTWRKSPKGQLRFVLSAPGEQPPGGRRRKSSQ